MALSTFVREGLNVALIMGAGDIIAQLAIEKKTLKDWNYSRTARFSALGLVFVGPALRKWYTTLDKLVVKDQPALHRGVKKMLIDQTCFAPIFTGTLLYLVPLINGEKHDKIVSRIKDSYFTIMKSNYMLWPMAQLINFSMVPVQYQVVFAQLVSLLWNCYLSVMLN